MSKSASRARSPVGRTSSPSGASSLRPRCLPAMMRMLFRGGLARAELLAQHALIHFLDRAALQIAELERAIGEADETRDRKAQMLHHAPHFAIAAFAQADDEPRVAALLALQGGVDRAVGNAFDRDARFER